MASASIFLATPCYGGMATIAYVTSLLALQRTCRDADIGLEVTLGGGDALIPRARAQMAAQFLANPRHTHLLFIDADIGFDPQTALRLLRADKDVVGGVYPAKQIHWDAARQAALAGRRDLAAAALAYVVRLLPRPDGSVDVDADGFAPVAYVGAGFLLIRRAVIERMVAAHPELRARQGDDQGTAVREAVMLFDPMIEPETGEYLSEDYAFCRRWRDLGGEVFADLKSRFTHMGAMPFEGSPWDASAG